MILRRLKNRLQCFSNTPIHPQWFCYSNKKNIALILQEEIKRGIVLDIGCATKWAARLLPSTCSYIGLDYPETADNWYKTRPDIYADAQILPFADNCFDFVLMLDILEHLPDVDQSLSEVNRILKNNGTVILQVPFLYPIHDAPLDFRRWSKYGLREIAAKNGFIVKNETYTGDLLQTSAIISNIAATKTVCNWISRKHLGALLILLLPFYITANNLLNCFFSAVSPKDDMMPTSYLMIWGKS